MRSSRGSAASRRGGKRIGIAVAEGGKFVGPCAREPARPSGGTASVDFSLLPERNGEDEREREREREGGKKRTRAAAAMREKERERAKPVLPALLHPGSGQTIMLMNYCREISVPIW